MEQPDALGFATPMHKPPLNIRGNRPPPQHTDTTYDVRRDGDDGDEISEEHAFGPRRGLSMRARMDRAGNIYSPGVSRSRENEIGMEYVRHTDAGAVRVVELPPLYNDLRR